MGEGPTFPEFTLYDWVVHSPWNGVFYIGILLFLFGGAAGVSSLFERRTSAWAVGLSKWAFLIACVCFGFMALFSVARAIETWSPAITRIYGVHQSEFYLKTLLHAALIHALATCGWGLAWRRRLSILKRQTPPPPP